MDARVYLMFVTNSQGHWTYDPWNGKRI